MSRNKENLFFFFK